MKKIIVIFPKNAKVSAKILENQNVALHFFEEKEDLKKFLKIFQSQHPDIILVQSSLMRSRIFSDAVLNTILKSGSVTLFSKNKLGKYTVTLEGQEPEPLESFLSPE